MAKRGITSLMPPEAYINRNFEWNWKRLTSSAKSKWSEF